MPENFAGGLNGNARETAIDTLNTCLAGTIALTLAVKQAHWNLKGSSFIGIHELLDDQADMLRENADEMAERCVIIGGVAKGTVQDAARSEIVEPYPTDIIAWQNHVSALKSRYMSLGAKLRSSIEEIEEAGDVDTADLLTGASRAVDKGAWFIGAHIEGSA